jgi:hypothetical protein
MSLSRGSAIPAYPRWHGRLSEKEHNPAFWSRLDAAVAETEPRQSEPADPTDPADSGGSGGLGA